MKLQTLSNERINSFFLMHPNFILSNASFNALIRKVRLDLAKNTSLSSNFLNVEMLTIFTSQFLIPNHSLKCDLMILARRGFQ